MLINYQYLLRGDFIKEISLNKLKSVYKTLIATPEFDGFSKIDNQKDGEEHIEARLTSKDNELSFILSNDHFELSFTNFEGVKKDFSRGWQSVRPILDIVNTPLDLIENLSELTVTHIFLYVGEFDRAKVGEHFLAKQLHEELGGFNLRLTYHHIDKSLDEGHYHEGVSIVAGALPPGLYDSKSFMSKLKEESDSILFNRSYRLDLHDGDLLRREEVLDFLETRIEQANSGRDALVELAGLSDAKETK